MGPGTSQMIRTWRASAAGGDNEVFYALKTSTRQSTTWARLSLRANGRSDSHPTAKPLPPAMGAVRLGARFKRSAG